MPNVATQKWASASFLLYSGAWKSLGSSQYTMPNVRNPFQPNAPVCTWAVGQFVLIPQLQKKIAAAPTSAEAPAETGHGGGHGAKEGKGGKDGSPNYQFENVVVNLAGTMGTRYLKTTFLVTGAEADIKTVFEANKPRLTDVTLNVLSSLSLSDLEEPGAKNVLREKLVAAYNQALGRKIAEQVYFSDFVVQ